MRFVPCLVGANHCRLRHIGWEKCGHGLSSRPRESASVLFLDELLGLFGYPPQSGRALVGGTLPLRCCAVRFSHSTPTWRLRASGRVRGLVAAYAEFAGNSGNEVSGLSVFRDSRSRPLRKRFRLNRKTPAHLVGVVSHSRPRVWKRLRQDGFSDVSMLITLGGDVIMQLGALFKGMTEWGLGNFPGLVQAYVSRFARLFN